MNLHRQLGDGQAPDPFAAEAISYDWAAPVTKDIYGWDPEYQVVKRPKTKIVLCFVEDTVRLWTEVGGGLVDLVKETWYIYVVLLHENAIFNKVLDRNPVLAIGIVQEVCKLTKDWSTPLYTVDVPVPGREKKEAPSSLLASLKSIRTAATSLAAK